jgi:rubrerythrin
VTDEDARALLAELTRLEAGHERKVRGILETLAPGHGTPDVGQRVEGGFSAGDLEQAAARFADDTAGLLGLAMMVECQALDLYLRLSGRGAEGSVRALWWELAADERAHLARLGALIDRRALA